MDGLTLLQQDERKDLLRFITAGSVDDGKSTLIGRLLVEAQGIYEDQLASVRKASSRRGSAQGEVDFSLFTDGLKAEREQNITIDVAYRYFSTPRRKFIIADTPGHEQYTRNMVTGASTASLMVILIDVTKGMLDQSRRHAFIASLLGIQHIVVAVNKMDLVDFSEDAFEVVRGDFTDFSAKLSPRDVTFIPVSALKGDNVVARSPRTPWYEGSTLLNHLETVHVASDRNLIDLRLPVQYVSRPDASFRGYMGAVASGVVRPGDEVVVLPSGAASRVREVLGPDGPIPQAFPPLSCCVTLEDEVDVSRGCMLVHPHNRPTLGAEFEAMMVWMGPEPFRAGRPYQVKHTTRSVLGEASAIRYRIDVNSLHRRDADALAMNEVGRVVMKLSQPIAWDTYAFNRVTGAFILIDRVTNNTVGAGMVLPRDPREAPASFHAAAPASVAEAAPQPLVSPQDRARRMGHRPAVVCLAGPAGAPPPLDLAYALEKRLFDAGCHCCVLREDTPPASPQAPPSSAAGPSPAEAGALLARSARAVSDAGLIVICAISSVAAADALRRDVPGDAFIDVSVGGARPAPGVEQLLAALRERGIVADA